MPRLATSMEQQPSSPKPQSPSSPHVQRKLVVLVDMDMVLCDFEAYFLEKYREKYPGEPFVPLEERTQFYIREQYATIRQDLSLKCREVYCAEGFFLNIPEIPGAVSAVKEMSQIENVEVFICTSPLIGNYRYCVKEKYEWIDKHLGNDWTSRMILTADKTVVNGHLLIDDKPNIKGVMKKPVWEQILFTACHNKNITLPARKRRLDSWTDQQWKTLIEEFKKKLEI